MSFDEGSGRWLLQKGVDPAKDQSYVLYCLSQQQLSHTLLPLGGLTKSEVRALAQTLDLPNAQKHESQDICFVPDGDYASFIEQHLGKTFPSGDFVRKDGAVLGTHRGIIRYTIGQRRGLGLALPAPLYVCEKDLANNRVVLCSNEELYSKTLTARVTVRRRSLRRWNSSTKATSASCLTKGSGRSQKGRQWSFTTAIPWSAAVRSTWYNSRLEVFFEIINFYWKNSRFFVLIEQKAAFSFG